MAPPRRNGPVLSDGFLKRLGIESGNGQSGGNNKRGRFGPPTRKDQRKEARTNKRLQRNGAPQTQSKARPGQRPGQRPGKQLPGHQASGQQHHGQQQFTQQLPNSQRNGATAQKPKENSRVSTKSGHAQQTRQPTKKDDTEDDDDDGEDNGGFEGFSSSEAEYESRDENADEKLSSSKSVSKRDREKLEQDDAEIADLERKLGIKGRKALPKSFQDDGLGDLLGEDEAGEDDEDEEPNSSGKRKLSTDDEEWLRAKRRKAATSGGQFVGSRATELKNRGADESDDSSEDDSDEEDGFDDSDEEGESVSSDEDSDGSSEPTPPPPPPKRKRENPYVAPVPASSAQKYVPPARRKALESSGAESEEVIKVRKQANRLIARLSDSNMLTILIDIEKMYQENPRKYVTDAVTDKLLEQITIDGVLSTSVIMLIAAFATAVYRIKGSDFGANFIQRTVTLFDERYKNERDQSARSWAPSSKAAAHLLSLVAELYNFGMIGPKLVYDYMRLLLEDFSETNTELLLRVIDTSGQFLRKDDPRTLKTLVQSAEMRANADKNLPVRAQHMMQQIKDLQKRGGKKKRRDAGGGRIEHAVKLKKILGRLSSSSSKMEATGALNISLADVKQSESSGKWWLVGARWAGPGAPGTALGAAARR